MPKEAKHIASAQKQRQKIKERFGKYAPSKVSIQVLGTGAEGAPRCLYVFSDQSRYLFNCGEGSQRLAHEHKMKLGKLEHIFITQATWKNFGGLPGTALTIQDVGVPEITLHGPNGLVELFQATRKFVVMKNMRVDMADCAEDKIFEDNVMSVQYVRLAKQCRKRDFNGLPSAFAKEEDDMSTQTGSDIPVLGEPTRKRRWSKSSDRGPSSTRTFDEAEDLHSYKTNHQRSLSENGSKTDRFAISEAMKSRLAHQKRLAIVMNYICRLKARPGTLNLSKCVEFGVPAGPKLGDLKSGRSVKLDNGTVITPDQVCEPDEPGPVFIVVDCPSEDYLDLLTTNVKINKHNANAACPEDLAYLVVHFTPSLIADDPRYQAWMDTFSPSTHHLFINDRNTCMGSTAVHRIQYKLNILNKELFPILGDHGTMKKALSDSTASINVPKCDAAGPCRRPADGSIQPGTFFSFHLRPRMGRDASNEIRLEPAAYIDETYALDGFCDEVNKLRIVVNRKAHAMTIRPYPKLLFLGTGSSIPNKTRNTSGILLSSTATSHILLDCGEGTYGQLIRFFGEADAMRLLADTHLVYISHLHADHHIGLIGFLQGRQRARRILGLPEKPVYLLAPQQIMHWLDFYDICFEDLNDHFELIPNAALLGQETIGGDAKQRLLNAVGMREISTCLVRHCPNAFGVSFTYSSGLKVVYSGDTMPSENLIALGENCDLLIHEATMEDELAQEAVLKMHSTTSQAIHVGERMKANHILLTHFSQRYAKLPRFNDNFTENVGIAFDNMTVSIDELPLLPLLYPSLKLMFAEHCEDMEYKALKRAKREERAQGSFLWARLSGQNRDVWSFDFRYVCDLKTSTYGILRHLDLSKVMRAVHA